MHETAQQRNRKAEQLNDIKVSAHACETGWEAHLAPSPASTPGRQCRVHALVPSRCAALQAPATRHRAVRHWSAPGAAHQPPCSVEMKVTRSPSATSASRVPLRQECACAAQECVSCMCARTRGRVCRGGGRMCARPGSGAASSGPPTGSRAGTRRQRHLATATHQSSQSVSFTSTSTPGRLQGPTSCSGGA